MVGVHSWWESTRGRVAKENYLQNGNGTVAALKTPTKMRTHALARVHAGTHAGTQARSSTHGRTRSQQAKRNQVFNASNKLGSKQKIVNEGLLLKIYQSEVFNASKDC